MLFNKTKLNHINFEINFEMLYLDMLISVC